MDPKAPAQDMSGLHSTYGNDRNERSKANEMLKTGHAIIVGRRGIFQGNAEENGITREGEEMADRWRIWLNLWLRCKKF